MGIDYLLVVCCQLAIATYYTPHSVNLVAERCNLALGIAIQAHLRVEHRVRRNAQLRKMLVSSAERTTVPRGLSNANRGDERHTARISDVLKRGQ